MAGITVNSTGFDVNAVLKTTAVSSSKKASSQVQDFNSVFNSTTQNSNSGQTSTSSSKSSSQKVSDTKDTFGVKDDVKDVDTKAAEETGAEKELEDNVEDNVGNDIIEDIATALNYIIDQIKEVLDVDDDAIVGAMEDLGLETGDLLNSDILSELVTALSGEDSVISLVADEDLYSKLQTLTGVVDNQLSTLLDDTGLSKEELSSALENLKTADDVETPETTQVLEELDSVKVSDLQDEGPNQVTEIVTEEESVQPQVIVQDNTTKPATTNSKLSENVQQDTSETTNNLQSDSTTVNKTEKKDYSENQSFGQSQQQELNENVAEITSENTANYTSDNTESIMRQLADTVKLIKEDNLTQMELQLHPSSLGTVNVSLISKGGVITAQFTTQSEQVRAAIEAQASQLQSDLEQQGIKVEAIEVSVESHEMEKNLDENNEKRQKDGERAEESLKTIRRANINLRELGEDGDVLEEIQGANEATRIAMEMMSAHGNTMDMLA